MIRSYRQFSGQNLGRLAALSDGIFAVAMTLLVLNIRLPTAGAPHTQEPIWAAGALAAEATVWNVLVPLAPHRLTWIHLVFLLAVVFMPFSTALLAEFITYRLPMVIYWINLFLLGLLLFISIEYAS